MDQINWMDTLGYTPKHLQQLRSCGYLYYKQGQFETAKRFFEMLRVFNPNHFYDLNMLGAIYIEMGEPKQALARLDEALNLEPMNESALLNRFKALLILGQKEIASDIALILLQSADPYTKNSVRALLMSHSVKIPAAL